MTGASSGSWPRLQDLQPRQPVRGPTSSRDDHDGGATLTPTSPGCWPGGRLPRRPAPRAARSPAHRPQVADLGGSQDRRSLARRFGKILQLLEAWGYLDGWALTARDHLVRIFHESDLLIAESIESGLLDGLEPAAGRMVSCFTYEHRSSTTAASSFPSANVEHRFAQMTQLAAEPMPTRRRRGCRSPPDAGFLGLAHAWVAGQPLDEIWRTRLSGGDFVRNAKLLIDLLRQVAEAAADPATARAARQAADLMFRGVVSASSVVPTAEPTIKPLTIKP
jgi:superfamily II RNA helicase